MFCATDLPHFRIFLVVCLLFLFLPMLLRSGRSLKFPSGSTQQLGNMTDPVNNVTPTIKILHQNPSFKLFSGDDPSYPPLEFLKACEDAMANSNIKDDGDKISFVRSNLKSGSTAASMMKAAAFTSRKTGNQYAVFRKNFLELFGPTRIHDALSWVFRFSESLTTDFGSHDYRTAQAVTSALSSEAMDALEKSAWFEDGHMSPDRLHSLFEIMFFIQFLSPAQRRIAASIPFSPVDEILHYGTKIAQKLSEEPLPSPSPKGPTAQAAPVQPDSSQSVPIAPVQSSHAPRPIVCSYCSKSGHKVVRCFQRKRDEANQSRSNTTSSNTPQSTHTSSSPSSTRPQSAPSRKWCAIHEYCGHTTETCRTIQSLRKKPTASTQTSTQSGEASRPIQHHPS